MTVTEINERAVAVGEFVAASGATVRAAAKRFGISKSTVHKDLTCRLKRVDAELYRRVSAVLAKNRAERHLRGGDATRMKYKKADSF